jgi:cellulose synthase/poly-beta-1,6-N-acetylglucosamine synthase-like glycosyltransferase
MFTILYVLFLSIQLLLAAYLLQPTILLLIYGGKKLAGLLFKKSKVITSLPDKEFSYAAIVTAYKNLQLVPPLVDSLLRQTYRNFKVYVVADACENSEIGFNNDPRVKVLLPEVALNAKVRSIDYAINNFDEAHDVLVILDADNLVHPDCLAVLNSYFSKGYRAVQTKVLPKNNDGSYAKMDAAGTLFSSFMDRVMRMELGLSANIWGFGTAVETALYKQVKYESFLGGFDKKVQADIVKLIPQLAYAEEAIVYDEKIVSGEAMEKQRTRWINAYFKYLKYGLDVFTTGLKRGSFNLVFFGFNLLRPPLFLQVTGAVIFALLNLWIAPPIAIAWMAALVIFPLSFIIIVAVMTTDKGVIGALLHLPDLFLRQVSALLHMSRANKEFLQTNNHKVIYIEDLLKK